MFGPVGRIFDDMAAGVLKQVTDLSGQIRGIRPRICQDRWVANLAGSPAGLRAVVRRLPEACGVLWYLKSAAADENADYPVQPNAK
jgi:hypothetical protein